MKKHDILLSISLTMLAAIIIAACSSTPDNVIPQEKMARLLADVHKGESVIELNRSTYYNDSLKKLLKQSIYMNHGVTAEQVDTSFVWYGHHVEEYIKVYDRVIELLEQDLDNANLLDANETVHIAVAGDSVDTWQSSRHFSFSRLSPVDYLTFALDRDDTWEKGDNYRWEFKTLNNRSTVSATIAVDYADGLTEFTSTNANSDGWTRLKLQVDTTRTPQRLYGVIHVTPLADEIIYVDSIALIRTRLNPIERLRRRSIDTFNYGKKDDDDD